MKRSRNTTNNSSRKQQKVNKGIINNYRHLNKNQINARLISLIGSLKKQNIPIDPFYYIIYSLKVLKNKKTEINKFKQNAYRILRENSREYNRLENELYPYMTNMERATILFNTFN